MAAPNPYSHAEVKAGVFLAFCLALFLGMLMVYGRVSRFWRGRQDIHVAFSSVGGLRPDAAVRYNGVEVGRVKNMRILHVDSAQIRRVVAVNRTDLDHLPLSAETRRQLRLLPDTEFEAAAKEALRDKTMIELTLEVLQEGQYRRYLTDDAIVLSTTILGDTCIDVISGTGHGRPLSPTEDALILGVTGDFFARLSRSMEEVKEVLSSVSDVVGGPERAAFKRGAGRLDGILDRMSSMSDKANDRLPKTSKRLTEAGKMGRQAMDSAKELVNDGRERGSRIGDLAATARKDLGERLKGLEDEAGSAKDEMVAQWKAVTADYRAAWDASKPHWEGLRENLRGLSAQVTGVADRLESVQETAGDLLEQSMPDLAGFGRNLSAAATNMRAEHLIYWREHIGEWATKGDAGEHVFHTALETYRGLRRITRWVRDVNEDLAALRPVVAGAEAGSRPTVADLDAAGVRVGKMQRDFEQVRDQAAEAFLPPFQGSANGAGSPPFGRKRAGCQEWPSRW
jgi:ABC-type transporter Mla subunit MlaD